MSKGKKKRSMNNEQFTAISVAILGIIQLLLHLWSDYRRQQQTKILLARPIHLEITLTDVSTDEPRVEAKMSRK